MSDVTERSAAFERRFNELEALVHDEGASYSGSQAFSQLVVLQKLARELGEDSAEHARTLALMALVESKREAFEDALELGTKSLEIQSRTAPLPGAFALRHLMVTCAEALQLYEEAAGHLKILIPMADGEPSLSDRQRLALKQHLGYLLHETERFDEACEVNLGMLRDAERLLGRDDVALTGVLGNLAQNHFSLGMTEEAEEFLRRRLALADAGGKDDIAIDSVFQLAALAFETGDYGASHRLFQERLERARKTGDAQLIEGAELDLAEHQRRLTSA